MSEVAPAGQSFNRPINLKIPDKKELYKSYMPLIKGGGLFIPIPITDENVGSFGIGQKVLVILSLMDEKTKRTISGKIIWVSKSANKGIGITLGEGNAAKMLKDSIETFISDVPNKADTPTYTF